MQPLPGQFLLQQMQLGDVFGGDDVVGGHAFGVVQQETREEDPDNIAAGRCQLALTPELKQLTTSKIVVGLAKYRVVG
jgi:hypothetical protein